MSGLLNPKRLHILKEGEKTNGPVVYWMQREQRVMDNWSLLFAQDEAIKRKAPLYVIFNLVTTFLDAAIRQYEFMLKGLEEAADKLASYNIPFVLLTGKPEVEIPKFIGENNVSTLYADFNPLKIVSAWKEKVIKKINIPFYEVDAHNIVPCRIASDKLEFAAYTIRPKINKLLPEFLTPVSTTRKTKD